MGLISRVSSRTYRVHALSKMLRTCSQYVRKRPYTSQAAFFCLSTGTSDVYSQYRYGKHYSCLQTLKKCSLVTLFVSPMFTWTLRRCFNSQKSLKRYFSNGDKSWKQQLNHVSRRAIYLKKLGVTGLRNSGRSLLYGISRY